MRRLAIVLLATLWLAACGGDDPPANAPSDGRVDVSGDPIRLRGDALIAELSRNPYRLTVRSTAGPLTAEQSKGPFYERGGLFYELERITAARAIEDGVELEVRTSENRSARVVARLRSERSLQVTIEPPDPSSLSALGDRFASPSDERIYGLTERLRDSPPIAPPVVEIPAEDATPVEVGSLDRRGEIVEMLVRPTIALYTPFFQSSKGYGLYVEGTAIGAFDLARSAADTIRFRFEAGESDASRTLTFHVFAGPDHADILDQYTALSGRPFVPPDWAFLHWRWHGDLLRGETANLDGVAVQKLVAEDVQMYETLGIPAGVYLLDRPVLEGNFGFARFAWDETLVPNTSAMLASLRRRGFRLATWSAAWACGNEAGDNGREARDLGFLAPGADVPPNCADLAGGNFILDVTNAAARSWFAGKISDFLRREALDGIKLDRGEEHIPSLASDIWSDGRSGREVRNDYPNLQAKLHHQALVEARPDRDFVLITRAGYAGTQADSIVWGGDITGANGFGRGNGTDLGLRSAIIAQLRAAFMGFPIWGSDTGGYYEFRDREVFARWLEFSAFSGIMEIGGTGNHAPWAMPTEPSYDEELIDIYRRYTRLRETLLPYIADAAREAGRTGMPIARPLVFAFREDEAVADLWDEYLFGPDLLVAPVWRSGQRVRDIYFPRGTWTSYWGDGEVHTGPTTVSVDVPLDRIPVYVRDGADVPR